MCPHEISKFHDSLEYSKHTHKSADARFAIAIISGRHVIASIYDPEELVKQCI